MQEQAAVVVVAGETDGGPEKMWIQVGGRLLLARTLDAFTASPLVSHIVLVVRSEHLARAHELCTLEGWSNVEIVAAGHLERRRDSVRKGLDHLAKQAPEPRWVMIHDGERPLATRSSEILEAGLQAAIKHQAAIAAVPAPETIKRVNADGVVEPTFDRSQLWVAQTLQVFAFQVIYQAYHSPLADQEISDGALLVQQLGHTVAVFPGSDSSLDDLVVANHEALIRSSQRSSTSRTRIGSGHDFHSFTSQSPFLVLGGVDVPHDRGLRGDVLIHATVDALLGALALGDIGQMFPTTDPRWKNQPSTLYLDHTVDLLHQQGWRINNVDATIIAARPAIAPHVPVMRAHLALHLKVDIDDVSIKATTTDGLGFVGRAEGIGCHVTALVAR